MTYRFQVDPSAGPHDVDHPFDALTRGASDDLLVFDDAKRVLGIISMAQKMRRYALWCARTFRGPVSPAVEECLAVGDRYAAGDASLHELLAARLRALELCPRSLDWSRDLGNAAGAAYHALHPDNRWAALLASPSRVVDVKKAKEMFLRLVQAGPSELAG